MTDESFLYLNPAACFVHARDSIGGRFPEGEEVISKDAQYSYYYANDVLKRRFELGEEAISRNIYYSLLYATNVLRGRFLQGEERIINSLYDSYYREAMEKLLTGNELVLFKLEF